MSGITAHGLSRLGRRQRVEVELIGCHPVKARMGPARVVEAEVPGNAGLSPGDGLVGMEVGLFVLHRFPQPLHEHVVAPTARAIHADPDTLVLEQVGKRFADELAALVGVEDLRGTVALQRLVDRLDTEVGVHRVGYPEGKHSPGGRHTAGPVPRVSSRPAGRPAELLSNLVYDQ